MKPCITWEHRLRHRDCDQARGCFGCRWGLRAAVWAVGVVVDPGRCLLSPVGGVLAGGFSLTGGTKQAGGSAGWGAAQGGGACGCRRGPGAAAPAGGRVLGRRGLNGASRAERRRLRRSRAARPSRAVGGLAAAAVVSAEAAARAGSVPPGAEAGRVAAVPRHVAGPGGGPLAVHPDDSDPDPGGGPLVVHPNRTRGHVPASEPVA